MKKRFLPVLLAVLAVAVCGGLFILGGIGTGLDKPPGLTVETGGETAQALRGTYSWMYRDGLSWTGVEADSAHPLDCKEWMPELETEEDRAVLVFEEAPDSISARCWSEVHWSDFSADSEDAVVNGSEIELKPGGYIYEVTAQWDSRRNWNGTAHYSFYIDHTGTAS